jgi:predicted RNase H-like HicB family nuclease
MTTRYDVVIEWDSSGHYVASVPQLPGFRMEAEPTQSPEDLDVEVREAIAVCRRMSGEPPDDFEYRSVRKPPKTPRNRTGQEACLPPEEENQ